MFPSSLLLNLLKIKLRLKSTFITLLSLGLLVSCSKPQAMDKVLFNNEVSVSIVTQKQYDLGKNIAVSFIIKNGTNKPIQLLKWGTPLEGRLTRNSFRITHQNKELSYQGPVFKRGKPSSKDYITLQALTSLQADMTLNSYYPLTLAGQYTIAYRTSYLSTKNTNSLIKLKASKRVNFIVTEPHK
jgi:hypothetical protein